MKGDIQKIKAIIKEYGVEFSLNALEKAVQLKDAEEMQKVILQTNKRMSEARINKLAREMGVRLG